MNRINRQGWLYVLPALFIFGVFVAYPLVFNVYIGFNNWSGIGEINWAGLNNYKKIFTDPKFLTAIKNFVIITVLYVVFDALLGMIIATFIRMKLFFSKPAKILIYLPMVLATVIIGYTFKYILAPSYGVLNTLLQKAGLGALAKMWLTDPTLVLFVLVVVIIWQGVGFAMILYTSGMSAISDSIYEAAEIDGAGELKKFFRITLPMLRSSTYTLMILNVITSVKLFDVVWALTKGGPGDTTITFTIYVYKKAFELYDMGAASAVSVIMLLLSLVLTAVQLKLYNSGREE